MRKTLTAVALCLAVATTSAGCFGRFALTRKIYGFNETVSGEPVVRSIVTWVLVFVPVYGLGALADFIVLNPIEFWSGSNPLAENEQCPGPRQAVTEQADGSATFACDGASYRLAPTGPGAFSLDRDGVQVGAAETTADGGLLVLGASGEVVAALSAAEVQARAATAEAPAKR